MITIPEEVLDYVSNSYVTLEKPSGRRYSPPDSARDGKTNEIVAKQMSSGGGYGLASTYIVAGEDGNYLDLYLITTRWEIKENNRDSKVFLGYAHYNYPWDDRNERAGIHGDDWYQQIGIRIYKNKKIYRISVNSFGVVGLTCGYGRETGLKDDPKDLPEYNTRKFFLGSCKDYQKADARTNTMNDYACSYWGSDGPISETTRAEIRKVFQEATDTELKDMTTFAEFIAKARPQSEKAKQTRKSIEDLLDAKKEEFDEEMSTLDPQQLFGGMTFMIYKDPYIMIGFRKRVDNQMWGYKGFFVVDNNKRTVYHTNGDSLTPAKYDGYAFVLKPDTMPKWVRDIFDAECIDDPGDYTLNNHKVVTSAYNREYSCAKYCPIGILRGIKMQPIMEQLKNFKLSNIAAGLINGEIPQRRTNYDKAPFACNPKTTSLKKAFKLSIPRLTVINGILDGGEPNSWRSYSTRRRIAEQLNNVLGQILGYSGDVPMSSLNDDLFNSLINWKDYFQDAWECNKLIRLITRSVDISPLEAYKRIVSMFSGVSTKVGNTRQRNYIPWGSQRTERQYIVNTYSDYLQMRTDSAADVDLHAYPIFPSIDEINRLHDAITEIRNRELARRQEDALKHEQEMYEKSVYPKAKVFEYTGDKYLIKCPVKLAELTFEGQKLHHCVGSYTKSVSQGNEYILFLRKNETPDTPWYTVDITPEKRIRQIHTKYNGNICDDHDAKDIQNFLLEWANARGIDPNEVLHTNGICCALM